MTAVSTDNQFDLLASSPRDESKDSSSLRSRKDDVKEQAYQARTQIKGKAAELREQIVGSDLVGRAQEGLQAGIQAAKAKVASLTGDASIKDKSNAEILEQAEDAAGEQWETVKKRGKVQAKRATDAVDEQLDANLTQGQRKQLDKGVRQAKQAGKAGLRQAQGTANGLFGKLFSAPQLRGVRTFIERNNLQLPVMIGGAILGLWLSLTLIRLVTMAATPSVPEFDIHSKEASMAWLKYHAGDLQNKAVDAKASIPARVASFLANHELDKVKADAIDWKDIGMRRLGLAEPTYTEQFTNWLTGRPTTWQGRVEQLVTLGRQGLKATALKQGLKASKEYVKAKGMDALGMEPPSYSQRLKDLITGRDTSLSGRAAEQARLAQAQASDWSFGLFDSVRAMIPGLRKAAPVAPASYVEQLKDRVAEGIDSVRSHLPGAEEARQRAYEATHPSTLQNIKSGAEYIKNRVVHGAEEAAHIAQDRANELADKAKYKTGL